MTENQKELKKEILKALIDKEWSATDLANAMGISRVYMNDLINGRRISVVRMEQIKKILGISQKGDNLLKQLRKELKLTQEELAKTLNLSTSYYVKLENGFMNPSYKVMKSLKEFYGEKIDLNVLVK